jgi:hypothetical protein
MAIRVAVIFCVARSEAVGRIGPVRARSRLPALRKLCRLFILGAAATLSIFTRCLGFGPHSGPELSVQILELCRERGRVTISDIAKATGANRNTIKDHVRALVDKAHLVRHGAGRGTWYALS